MCANRAMLIFAMLTGYTLTCKSPEEYTTSAEVGKCCDPQTPCSMVDFCSDGTVFFSNDDYFTW